MVEGAPPDANASSSKARCHVPHADVIFASFLNHLFTFGTIYSCGTYAPAFMEHFDTSLAVATSIVSVMTACQFMGSLLMGLVLPHRIGHRSASLLCGATVLVAYCGASFAEDLWLMFVLMGVVGLGLGAANLVGLAALNATVKERRARAVGFASCGTGIGAIVLSQLIGALLGAAGWRWALRVVGLLAGLVLMAVSPYFAVPPPQARPAVAVPARPQQPARCRPPCADARYLCWWLNVVVAFTGFFAPHMMLAQFAEEELRLQTSVATTAYSLMGLSGVAARLVFGLITERCGGPRRIHFACQLVTGLNICVFPFCWDAATLWLWSCVFGFMSGPQIAMISVILSEVFGVEKLPLYHGVSRLGVGIATFAGPPLIAQLVDGSGWLIGFFVAGSLVIASNGFLVAMSILQASHEAKQRTAGVSDTFAAICPADVPAVDCKLQGGDASGAGGRSEVAQDDSRLFSCHNFLLCGSRATLGHQSRG